MEAFAVAFNSGDMRLAGDVVRPAVEQPCPGVVFVHGSGPASRDSSNHFVIMREHLVAHGFAVLAYDKPGVGGSSGDWRQQSFADRAREVVAGVRFLQAFPGVDGRRVGLLGGSQAGWVMPLAAHLAPDLAFVISVSGAAVTPHEQETYRIERQMRVDGFGEDQVRDARSVVERRLAMIRQGLPIARIFAMQAEAREEPWYPYLGDETPEDVAFFAAICDFDPVPLLEQVRCPFLGIWGELDTNVPVEQSLMLTRAALTKANAAPFQLKVFPRANHGLRLAQTGSPHEEATTFAPGYLETVMSWLAAHVGR